MIICPNCKEEIDDNSYYCDQCGQALLYCDRCGRVGIGRRCTYCGGLMISPEEKENRGNQQNAVSSSISSGFISQATSPSQVPASGAPTPMPQGIPALMLYNDSLNIRVVGINGAVIGRTKGPYTQFFEQSMYVSGVHAQLKYKAGSGWCITDKHSSNGTKVNEHLLQPDVDMSIKNGDIVTIANINLQVSVN